MKAALLISGYLRTLQLNIESIQRLIINQFDRTDVYIHVTKNEDINDRYLNPKKFNQTINHIEEKLCPTSLLIEDNENFTENKKDNDLLNLWSKFHKLNELKKKRERECGTYDVVIKTRPDVHFNSIDFQFKDKISIPKSSKIDRDKLTNLNDPFICDIFAYGPSVLMDKYFEIYTDLHSLISKHGHVPETLLFRWLEKSKIPYELSEIDYNVLLSRCNTFAICGDSGSGKSTLGESLKKHFTNSFLLECDRYHRWERGHENWSKMTHLNPEANFLAKMSEDIFDLKIGNSIYQVDYDHSNGKFTEKEKIDSTDNIIVCGLHSLYNEHEGVYDLKIFMDTDDDLKFNWKFDRDQKTRGYTKEKILRQIEERKDDYKKHILPQRNESDVIVNFYQKLSQVYLRIFIKKNHDVSQILKTFREKNVSFEAKENQNFIELNFFEYLEDPLWNFQQDSPNKLYNFVIYIVLNLA